MIACVYGWGQVSSPLPEGWFLPAPRITPLAELQVTAISPLLPSGSCMSQRIMNDDQWPQPYPPILCVFPGGGDVIASSFEWVVSHHLAGILLMSFSVREELKNCEMAQIESQLQTLDIKGSNSWTRAREEIESRGRVMQARRWSSEETWRSSNVYTATVCVYKSAASTKQTTPQINLTQTRLWCVTNTKLNVHIWYRV